MTAPPVTPHPAKLSARDVRALDLFRWRGRRLSGVMPATMRKLAERGLVETDTDAWVLLGGDRVYRITPAGIAAWEGVK